MKKNINNLEGIATNYCPSNAFKINDTLKRAGTNVLGFFLGIGLYGYSLIRKDMIDSMEKELIEYIIS